MRMILRHVTTSNSKNKTKEYSRSQEKGIALVVTMMLGIIMVAGVSGLLARQLMSRRLSSKESFEQMAEAAANNGFNRILGELNNADPKKNRGFLFTLNNRENIDEPNNGFDWARINTDNPPTFSEICLDTKIGLPEHPGRQENAVWPTTEVPLIEGNENSMREDGISKVKTFYRLRGYSSPGTTGISESGEAKFIIEGIVRRVGTDPNSYLARSRLERSLYIQSWVDANLTSNWAILAASHFDLGPIQLDRAGLILWHAERMRSSEIRKDCNTTRIIERLRGDGRNTNNLASKIWPIINQKQPPSNIFKIDGNEDHMPGQRSEVRVWRIDDTPINLGRPCRWSVICQRGKEGREYSRPTGIISRPQIRRNDRQWQMTDTIRLEEQDICEGRQGDCHIYVEQINLQRSRLLIENESRPVIIHLIGTSGPDTNGQSQIKLGNGALICGVNRNSDQCNNKPERLIVTTESTQPANGCNSRTHRIALNGESLPAAWILMRNGTVALVDNSQVNGIIWTHSFCSNNFQLTLSGESKRNKSKDDIQRAHDLWNWKEQGFAGYGRKTTRGIRGTSLDQFQRF